MDALTKIYSFGALLRGQVQQMCGFQSVTRTNARILQLKEHAFITRVEMPAVLAAAMANGCQAIYTLGTAGVPIVAARLGMEATAVWRGVRRGAPTALWHALQAADFAIRLTNAVTEEPGVSLEPYLAERLCRHTYEVREGTSAWRVEEFKPDGVFFLHAGAGPLGYALEIDRGHASAREFLGKFATHATYREQGLFHARYGTPFVATLTVTTHPARVERLRLLAERAGNANAWWFTTFEKVERYGSLAAIWRRPHEEAQCSVLPATHAQGRGIFP